MAFTREDVQIAITTLFTGAWAATPAASVSFENNDFDSAAQTGPWVEIVVQRSSSTQMTIDLYQTMAGFIWFTAYVPMAIGRSVAMQLLDAASAIFIGAKIAVGSTAHLTITSATGEIPNTKTGWFGVQVGFRFNVI